MGKGCDLSDFDCGMIVGARHGGLSISETADLLGFSLHNSLWSLQRMVRKNKKHPVSSSFAGRNILLMREVRGEGPDWSKVTVTQITTHYNSDMLKSISEHITCQTSKWIGYSSRRLNKSKR